MSTAGTTYPERAGDRDAWILERRGSRNAVTPARAHGAIVERELGADGTVHQTATIFLTNRECPYRCVMCDLWKNTLGRSVEPGVIPSQIRSMLAGMPAATVIKLYNSGSFFDRKAIPAADHPEIAALLKGFARVIVECHPAMVGDDVERFRDMLGGELEVAMGLETAHPEVLERLNKRMTLDSYAAAAAKLRTYGVESRAFVLIQPPFLRAELAVEWAVRSAEFAFDHGAGAASLIPVRGGNGALEALAASGDFTPPTIETLETALDAALALGRGRVFADLWDLGQFSSCDQCLDRREGRLRVMNLTQALAPRVPCGACGAA